MGTAVLERPEVQAPPAGSDVASFMDKAICVVVQISKPGKKRAVNSNAVEVDADRDSITVSKTLLDSPEFSAVLSVDTKIRQWLYRRCLPSMFRKGMYLLPITKLEEADETLLGFQAERLLAVEKVITAYPTIKENDKVKLRSLWDESDYVSVDKLRAAFSFNYRFVSFATPGKLANISKALFEREKEKLAKSIEGAREVAQQIVRAEMAQVVDHLLERLTGQGDNGKKKTFKAPSVENVRSFLDGFSDRNLADDKALEELVNQARRALENINAKDLRKDEDLRANVTKNFADIRATLDTMIVDRPARQISFDEE